MCEVLQRKTFIRLLENDLTQLKKGEKESFLKGKERDAEK
jgi:hypothetical protein